jgi:hypothetical protein
MTHQSYEKPKDKTFRSILVWNIVLSSLTSLAFLLHSGDATVIVLIAFCSFVAAIIYWWKYRDQISQKYD